MSVRTKTILIISLTLIGLLLLVYVAGSKIVLNSFERLEQDQVHENLQRVVNALNGDLQNLSDFAGDWSDWDDSYEFMVSKSDAYIKSNLPVSSYTGNKLNIIAFLDTRGKVVYGQKFDNTTNKLGPIPKSITQLFGAESYFLSAMREPVKPVTGLLLVPEGLLHIVSRAILTSEVEGPARGVLIMARFLDDAYIEKISKRTRISVSMQPIYRDKLTAEFIDIKKKIDKEGGAYTTRILGQNRIAGYSIANDMNREQALFFKTENTRDIYQQGLKTLNYLLLAIIFTALIFAAVIIILLQKTVLGRLYKLSHQVSLVSSKEERNLALHYDGNDEISSLTKHINTMLIDLNKSHTDLEREKEHAEEANKAKSQFLTRMSHELRTPLNAILGFAQLLDLDEKIKSSDKHENYVKHILGSGIHLLDMVNDVLDLASIEADKLEIIMGSVNVSAVIKDCVETMQPLALERDISLKYVRDINTENYVKADGMRLKQVLLNFISNAIKYNTEHGTVRVFCENRDNGYTRISVSDTGYGISKEDQADIFKPFNRLYLDTYSIKGTGIGLSISQRLAQLMMGSVGLISEVEKGSTFWAEFEIDEEAESEQQIEMSVTPDISVEKKCKHTILYVEDSPSHIELLVSIFKLMPDIQLLTAHTPLLGLELAISHKPDLIILDISLPGMDGYELLGKLRDIRALQYTPIIALSANAMPSEVEKGLRAGFQRYLTKPIMLAEFNKALADLLDDKTISSTK